MSMHNRLDNGILACFAHMLVPAINIRAVSAKKASEGSSNTVPCAERLFACAPRRGRTFSVVG